MTENIKILSFCSIFLLGLVVFLTREYISISSYNSQQQVITKLAELTAIQKYICCKKKGYKNHALKISYWTNKTPNFKKPLNNYSDLDYLPTDFLKIPDSRTFDQLFQGQDSEVYSCVSGQINCEEFPVISALLPERKYNHSNYKNIVDDVSSHTSPYHSKFTVLSKNSTNVIKIESYDFYNKPKTIGGDFWLARVESEDRKSLLIEGNLTDYGNGSYLLVFPNLVDYVLSFADKKPKIEYQQEMNIFEGFFSARKISLLWPPITKLSVRIVLERSTEFIDINRRAMSSLHFAGRSMTVALPCQIEGERSYRPYYMARSRCTAYCTMFPMIAPAMEKYQRVSGILHLPKVCNFSESEFRTWFCYKKKGQPNQSCEYGEQTGDITIETNPKSSFIKALAQLELLRSYTNANNISGFLEDDFHQKTAFVIDYQPNFDMEPDLYFKHWIFDNYKEKRLSKKEIKGLDSRKESFKQYEENRWIRNKTFVVIGDSLGRQVFSWFNNHLRSMPCCKRCETTVIDFWGESTDKNCRELTGFQPTLSECGKNGNYQSGILYNTQHYMFKRHVL